MKPKTIFLLALAILLVLGIAIFLFSPDKSSPNPAINIIPEVKKETAPSETFIEYTDPTGFSFSYPDNISIEKNEEPDVNSYADLQLFSKDVSGSLSLRITDTKLKTLEAWVKETSSSATPTEKKLGSLKAYEIKTKDRLFLGAIDQGILFNIEMPLIERGFWMKVYDKVLADFTFAAPETTTATAGSGSSEEIVFEGEEVVE